MIASMRRQACIPLLLFLVALQGGEIASDGVRLYYDDRGRGESVVLIHGFSLNSRMWDRQHALAKKYRLIIPDMRLHGRSPITVDTKYSLAVSAGDIRALLDHLKIRDAHIVGMSMGGTFAIEVALRHPERVRSLTLVAAGIEGVPPSKEMMERFMKGIELYKTQGAAAFRDFWIELPLFAPLNSRPNDRRWIEEMMGSFQFDTFLAMSSKPLPQSPVPQIKRLNEIKQPTLILIGTSDATHIQQASETAAREIPGARRIVYEGTGHLLNMEEPEKFNRDLDAFLSALPKR